MKIELNYGPQTLADRVPAASQTGRTAGLAGSGALGEDEARLSAPHLQVAVLAAQASQLPEVRQERVQQIRQAMQSGQYEVSPEKIAGALVVHMISGPAA